MLIKIWTCILGIVFTASYYVIINSFSVRGKRSNIERSNFSGPFIDFFPHKSWRKNTKIFPVLPFFCMFYKRCLLRCPYSKETVLPKCVYNFELSCFCKLTHLQKINSCQYKPCILKTKNLLFSVILKEM